MMLCQSLGVWGGLKIRKKNNYVEIQRRCSCKTLQFLFPATDYFGLQLQCDYYFSLDMLQILNFESSSSVVHERDSVWFKSQIRSKTMYEVQWFHNGYLITNSSRRYKMTSSKTEKNTYLHILLIANVLHRDMGKPKMMYVFLVK